jgi:hypothetical protein
MRKRTSAWVRKHHRGLIIAASVVATVVVGFVALTTWYYVSQIHKPYKPGVSFSIKYANELGVDPKTTLSALINDLGVRQFRLMSYWDLGEPTSGKYDFSQLDWQMKMAEDSGSKVSLAIGMRQPRWPECHIPDWATKLSPDARREALNEYMIATVNRYKKSPALASYQLENEALNTAFGNCSDFNRARLVDEFKKVKAADPGHPIIISVSNEFGLPLGVPRGDMVGFSIYHRVYDNTVTHRYIEYPIPAWYHGLRAAFIKMFTGRDTVIHELQGEPWGPKATKDLTLAEQSQSMDPQRLIDRVGYAQATGIRSYDLWGGEWWYWRMVKYNDPSLWNAARSIYAQPIKKQK